MGHSCATSTVLQLCFHVVPLAHILQDPLPESVAFLNSALNSYTTGSGPLDLRDLIPIPATISGPSDVGELLTHLLNQLREAQPKQKYPMSITLSLYPSSTLLVSLYRTGFTSPIPRTDSVINTIILQIDRADLSGRKNATVTQFPRKLDRECQFLAGGGREGTEYELEAVVVHQGNSTKGHYITFLKPAEGPHWALFDDHNVQWVQEKEVLAQEATILVYTRPDCMVEDETITILDDEQEEGSSPLEMGKERNIHAGRVKEQTPTPTAGGSTLERQDTRELVDDTLQPPASGNLPETGDRSLYRELLERVHQDSTTQERDLEEAMTGTPNKE